jgi:hypothetical protein
MMTCDVEKIAAFGSSYKGACLVSTSAGQNIP